MIRENTLYKKKKETQVSTNRRSNNWALKFKFTFVLKTPIHSAVCQK